MKKAVSFRIMLIISLLLGYVEADEFDNVLQKCQNEGLPVEECKGLIEEVTSARVVVLHSRTINDQYYNQVVVPVDFKGTVVGGSQLYDSVVYYPFEWRGAPYTNMGTRFVGPWDCSGMQDVQCCEMIEASVPDRDINEKYLDCWIEESLQRDPTTGEMKLLDMNADGTVGEASFEAIAHVEARDANERVLLMSDIVVALQQEQVPRDLLQSIYARTRHLLRGWAQAQPLPYVIKSQLRNFPNSDPVPKVGAVLDTVLHTIFDSLRQVAAAGGLHKLKLAGGEPENVVILTVDSTNGLIQSYGVYEG